MPINDDGNPSVIWDGDVKLYSITGDEEPVLSTVVPRKISAEFTHDEGTLSDQDLWGMIWIGKRDSSQEPWQLHTEKDWTKAENPLVASDFLDTGNTQFVEMESGLNYVTLTCSVNPELLEAGIDYIIYARVGKKSLG